MFERIKFERFTAFEHLEITLSPGINLFLGENGTGKTHILKAAYAACDITKSKGGVAEKINTVFHPSGKQIGRLVKRSGNSNKGSLEVVRRLEDGREARLRLSLSGPTAAPSEQITSPTPSRMGGYPVPKATCKI